MNRNCLLRELPGLSPFFASVSLVPAVYVSPQMRLEFVSLTQMMLKELVAVICDMVAIGILLVPRHHRVLRKVVLLTPELYSVCRGYDSTFSYVNESR